MSPALLLHYGLVALLIVGAIVTAIHGNGAWGWFLFVAFLAFPRLT